MRDIKYIIKRVIIGVGIILVLAYIRTGKALALDTSNLSVVSSYRIIPNGRVYDIAYDRDNDRMYIYAQNDTNHSIVIFNVSQYPYFYCWNQKSVSGSNFASAINGVSDSPLVSCVFSNKKLKYYYNSNGAKRFMGLDESFQYQTSATYHEDNYLQYFTSETSEFDTTYNLYRTGFVDYPNYYGGTYNYKRNGTIISNYDIYNYSTNELYYGANLSFIPGVPTIVSLQAHKNIQNGLLYSYQFSPKFSSFDTTNYSYQWKLGHDSSWVDFEENEQLLNFRQDGELYVRIVDKSNNSVVANENFVIHGIGQASSSSIFNISFSSTYSTSSDNSTKLGINVDEVKVDITFYPVSDKYRYQYKFVPSGTSQNDVVWTTSASTKISYTTTVNGTIYARITDTDYNSLFDKTHVINNIGTIGIGYSSESTNNFFSNISSGLNFSGPISSLINIPLKLISTIATGVAGGSTCTDYPLGSLFGTSLVLPCVNIKQHLGNSLYTTIDLIIACCMIYYIIKMFGELYTNLLFMSKNPIYDLGKRGD